jgi:type I restriction enzyme R subunit
MEQNEEIFARYMNERDFRTLVAEWMSRKIYSRLREKHE